MKPPREPQPQPSQPLLTRVASLSPRLQRMSEWLDTSPAADPARGEFHFPEADREAAKARDLADRRAMAGRDVLAREPESFEMQGRTAKDWLSDMRARQPWTNRRDLEKQAAAYEALPWAAYVVVVVRIDRAGRKLAKFLCPRFPENGAIPVDEGRALAWALIPSVDWWGTRCDSQPAKQICASGGPDDLGGKSNG